MLLKGKTAVVFAATGAIAGGVAHAFAREGAIVHISGRDLDRLNALAEEIGAQGGVARVEQVDATDPSAVDAYVARIARDAGSVDIHFNGIGGRPEDLGYPEPSTSQSLDRFMIPVERILGSTFLTARACGRQMMAQGSGSIVTLSATLSGMAAGYMAGISATCGAIEAMTRALAGEFGPHGVRVNCVRGSAMPETRTIQETFAGQARVRGGAPMAISPPPLGRPITVAETANTAAFLASDLSSGTTGQVVTVCAGAFV